MRGNTIEVDPLYGGSVYTIYHFNAYLNQKASFHLSIFLQNNSTVSMPIAETKTTCVEEHPSVLSEFFAKMSLAVSKEMLTITTRTPLQGWSFEK